MADPDRLVAHLDDVQALREEAHPPALEQRDPAVPRGRVVELGRRSLDHDHHRQVEPALEAALLVVAHAHVAEQDQLGAANRVVAVQRFEVCPEAIAQLLARPVGPHLAGRKGNRHQPFREAVELLPVAVGALTTTERLDEVRPGQPDLVEHPAVAGGEAAVQRAGSLRLAAQHPGRQPSSPGARERQAGGQLLHAILGTRADRGPDRERRPDRKAAPVRVIGPEQLGHRVRQVDVGQRDEVVAERVVHRSVHDRLDPPTADLAGRERADCGGRPLLGDRHCWFPSAIRRHSRCSTMSTVSTSSTSPREPVSSSERSMSSRRATVRS